MKIVITALQIIVSSLLILSIILQQKGSSLGTAFGGMGETYRSKRGVEKFLFYASILFAVLFASASILALLFE